MLPAHRRYMTMLELLIVFSLIALAGGAIAFNLRNAFVDQRFRSEVDLVAEQIRLAQNMMLVLNQDVALKFHSLPNNQGIELQLEFDTVLPRGWDREFFRKKLILKDIRSLSFTGTTAGTPFSDDFELHFFSRGSVMSKGTLRLATADTQAKGLERFICLPGYPSPVEITSNAQADIDCSSGWEEAYEEDLTRDMMSRIARYETKPAVAPETTTPNKNAQSLPSPK